MTQRPHRTFPVELRVFADYNSFELTDAAATDRFDSADWIDGWVESLVRDQIAAGDGIVGIGTARRMEVPVVLDIRTGPPDLDPARFDHVTEAGLRTGGTIIVSKQEYGPRAPRLVVPPGGYRLRVYTRGLDTLDPYGLEGEDDYLVVLWPGEPGAPRVVKRYPGLFPGG
jgi:hypothetical protein